MTLRKTKVSIVINAIYVLIASALCIITVMDAAEGFGFSYLPGLICFAAIMALGLGLKKLLSFTSGSDRIKAVTEKGDFYGLVIFLILIVFAIIFRIASYAWNGLGGNAYFELAKVTGTGMKHYVHACDDWYLTLLHGIFFLFGNKIFIAAIFNCILQFAAVTLGFAAFRKMLGVVPALFFTAFWTITGFSVHEALTLNSRNLVFLLITLTLFVLSTCIPASSGKFFSYLISGLLVSVCIYADIAGLVLIPFVLGILLNDMSEDEDNSFGLRISKMLFTLVSTVFGLVVLIFVDSYLTSSNPFNTLSSICSLYKPSGSFTLGFSYMTSYAEIVVMAVIVTLGIFVCFFSEHESRFVLLLSALTILAINHFGMTYLENDGREIFFMIGALVAGVSFRELFPAEIVGDVFKASAEMYDNEFSAPDKGYVPTGLMNAESTIEFDDLSDLDIKPEADPVPENASADDTDISNSEAAVKAESTASSGSDHSTEGRSVADNAKPAEPSQPQRDYSPMETFDAVVLPGHEHDTRPQISQGQLTSQAIQASLPPKQPGEAHEEAPSHTSQVSFASEKTEETKKSVYVPYGKPQLKPEYRRRPGAWMQAINEKNRQASENSGIKLGATDKQEEKVPVPDKNIPEKNGNASDKPVREIAPNGAVMLENPIPHPVRKTEHKAMEYDIDVTDDKADYDIKISDDDDYDI